MLVDACCMRAVRLSCANCRMQRAPRGRDLSLRDTLQRRTGTTPARGLHSHGGRTVRRFGACAHRGLVRGEVLGALQEDRADGCVLETYTMAWFRVVGLGCKVAV
jgi:hypothetical protein